MKIKQIDGLYSRVTPDEGKRLVVGNDNTKYSVVDVKTRDVWKVGETNK